MGNGRGARASFECWTVEVRDVAALLLLHPRLELPEPVVRADQRRLDRCGVVLPGRGEEELATVRGELEGGVKTVDHEPGGVEESPGLARGEGRAGRDRHAHHLARSRLDEVKRLAVGRPPGHEASAGGHLPPPVTGVGKRPHENLVLARLVGSVRQPPAVRRYGRVELGEAAGHHRHRRGVAAGADAHQVARAGAAVVGADHEPLSVARPVHLLHLPVDVHQQGVGTTAVGVTPDHDAGGQRVTHEGDHLPVGRPDRPPIGAAERDPREGPAIELLDPDIEGAHPGPGSDGELATVGRQRERGELSRPAGVDRRGGPVHPHAHEGVLPALAFSGGIDQGAAGGPCQLGCAEDHEDVLLDRHSGACDFQPVQVEGRGQQRAVAAGVQQVSRREVPALGGLIHQELLLAGAQIEYPEAHRHTAGGAALEEDTAALGQGGRIAEADALEAGVVHDRGGGPAVGAYPHDPVEILRDVDNGPVVQPGRSAESGRDGHRVGQGDGSPVGKVHLAELAVGQVEDPLAVWREHRIGGAFGARDRHRVKRIAPLDP